MVIDSKGKMFEDRRKKDRRKNSKENTGEDKRIEKDRRDLKNKYTA